MEEDQYKDLMGPPLKKEIIKKVESITDTFPYKFDKDDKEFIVKKVFWPLSFLLDHPLFIGTVWQLF